MQVSDVMTQDVESISPTANIQEAASLMRRMNIGFLPVCEGRHTIGVLTDRDIAIRLVADGQDASRTIVREIMSEDVISCSMEIDVEEAAEIMEQQKIRRLVVVNDRDELVGVVSLGDMAVDTSDDRLSGEILREVSQPVRSWRR